jgi:hypothetical protein
MNFILQNFCYWIKKGIRLCLLKTVDATSKIRDPHCKNVFALDHLIPFGGGGKEFITQCALAAGIFVCLQISDKVKGKEDDAIKSIIAMALSTAGAWVLFFMLFINSHLDNRKSTILSSVSELHLTP